MEDPWPEDMERRREASIRRFLRSNPDYVLLQPLSEQQQQRRHSGGKRSSVSPGARFSRPENRWDLATTLELLEQIKDYCSRYGWRAPAGITAKWLTISAHLSNPRGLEKRKYARSCQVRYENLRRAYNGDKLAKWALVHEQVQRSMVEVLRLVEHALAGPTKSPSGPLSPPFGRVCKFNQKSMENLPSADYGTCLSMESQTSAQSENQEDLDDHETLPLRDANDDAHGVATCGNLHPVSRSMGTRSEARAAAWKFFRNFDNDGMGDGLDKNYKNFECEDMGGGLVEPAVELLEYEPIAKRLRAARTRVAGKDITVSRPSADGITGNRRGLQKYSKIAR